MVSKTSRSQLALFWELTAEHRRIPTREGDVERVWDVLRGLRSSAEELQLL